MVSFNMIVDDLLIFFTKPPKNHEECVMYSKTVKLLTVNFLAG